MSHTLSATKSDQAQKLLEKTREDITHSIDCDMMDASNVSDMILAFARPVDIVIHLSLLDKTHTFTAKTFCALLIHKRELLRNVIRSRRCTLVVEDRCDPSNPIVFSRHYTSFDEFASFITELHHSN
jgi:hypothetical protein